MFSSSLVVLLLFPSLTVLAQNGSSIVDTKHNLSISSPGTVHATTESEICIFCHTPHFATGDGPLWNHQMSAAVYQPYQSTTLKATVGQPTGSSRLCLSCHDGTVALGMVHSRSSEIQMNVSAMPAENSLTTDLRKDHPVSFVYDNALATADGNLRDPSTLPQEVRLDRSGQLQCTSCHDPHNNQFGSFLVMDNTGSALCVSCHNLIEWPTSPHALSGQALPVALAAQITAENGGVKSKAVFKPRTVAAAGCASCHVPHAAGTQEELTRYSTPEQNCYSCHASQGPGQNVAAEFGKTSAHPILLNSQSHSASENLVNPPMRHATCVDCHNPHASNKTVAAVAGTQQLAGSLASVAGVSAGGSVLRKVSHEYELCFRCHGDSAQRGQARITRQFVETDTRRQFNPGNASFHPVEVAGKNSQVPSLIPPLTPASRTQCTDCHNNDQGPGNGGSGPRGPHGSAFVPLLERMLLLTDGTPYNPGNFALCYKCHNPMVVDSSLATSWSGHRTHLENYRAVCTTCHDSHASQQTHLINFNTTYVLPLNGALRYASTGVNHGTCTLTCHDGTGQNHPHNAQSY